MIYIVCYDIADDGVRGKVAGVLERYGERVQESVFEARLDAERLDELTARLAETLGSPAAGQIRLYRLCADCLKAALGIGTITGPALSKPCVVA